MIGHIGFHTSPGADYLGEWSPGGAEFGLHGISRRIAAMVMLAKLHWL